MLSAHTDSIEGRSRTGPCLFSVDTGQDQKMEHRAGARKPGEAMGGIDQVNREQEPSNKNQGHQRTLCFMFL